VASPKTKCIKYVLLKVNIMIYSINSTIIFSVRIYSHNLPPDLFHAGDTVYFICKGELRIHTHDLILTECLLCLSKKEKA